MSTTGTSHRAPEPGAHLTGSYRVRMVLPAFQDVRRLCTKKRDAIEIRAHALKLRYWPAKSPTDVSGTVLDLDWTWVLAMKGLDVGELRIDDRIGDSDNLRVIFYVGPTEVREPLPMIWVLRVMQKKRNEFTTHDIDTFKARRTIVVERFYRHREFK